MTGLRLTWLLLRREITIEWRTREVLYTSVLFALVLVTLMVFSGFADRATMATFAPGALWVSIAFVGTLVFSRTFERERDGEALAGLILTPGVTGALFYAKLVANVLLMGVVQLVLVPAILLTFHASAHATLVPLILVLAAGTLGYAALGTVLAAALASIRMREVLLPLLLFPLAIPLLIAGVRSHALLLQAGAPDGWTDWLSIMIAFDVLFVLLARWLFIEAVDAG